MMSKEEAAARILLPLQPKFCAATMLRTESPSSGASFKIGQYAVVRLGPYYKPRARSM